jgi:hypothetical protein
VEKGTNKIDTKELLIEPNKLKNGIKKQKQKKKSI